MTIDFNRSQVDNSHLGLVRDEEMDDLDLPPSSLWQRCGSVHCIDNGPWIGTLVCCIRRSGHDGEHSMSLGDADGEDYWPERWF